MNIIFFKKNLSYFFIIFAFFIIFIISITGINFNFYNLKWHYLSTPFGLLEVLFKTDEQLSNWFLYLIKQKAIVTNSILQILISVFGAIISLFYLIYIGEKK